MTPYARTPALVDAFSLQYATAGLVIALKGALALQLGAHRSNLHGEHPEISAVGALLDQVETGHTLCHGAHVGQKSPNLVRRLGDGEFAGYLHRALPPLVDRDHQTDALVLPLVERRVRVIGLEKHAFALTQREPFAACIEG